MRIGLTFSALLALTLAAFLPGAGAAQSPFSPAIIVNDRVVTQFELDQRIGLLRLFRAPGNLPEVAREGLIEDRLKLEELDRAGLRLTDEALLEQMAVFAERANLELEQFLAVLDQNGIERETFRDFVRVGVSWRDFIRSRYGSRVQITEAEIDQALGQSAGASTGIEVLLSEIIIAAPPPRAAQAQAQAERIATLTSTAAFEAQARRVSALPSRTRGGRLDWLPISNYPPQLRSIILALGNGEVTAPIPIENGIALFQMRGVREVPQATVEPAAIEYAAYYIAGGLSDQGLRRAAQVAANVDTCDDLYGVAQGQAADVLQRDTLPPAEIPQDVAMRLAALDAGEVDYSLTRSDGETLVFLMLCGRTPTLAGDVDRDAIRAQLISQRLAGYADALLADLQASATITFP
ncbi:peptidylprolyl isomerase [Octadecabacter sp. R77987]|uniref:peptidylprolyl isomerase n=1 Tax=Octadecabacter sp. R77987 TaxID=3093874 RepID=UPI00366D71EF